MATQKKKKGQGCTKENKNLKITTFVFPRNLRPFFKTERNSWLSKKKKNSLKRQWCFMWIHQIVLPSNIKFSMPTMPYKFLLHSATKKNKNKLASQFCLPLTFISKIHNILWYYKTKWKWAQLVIICQSFRFFSCYFPVVKLSGPIIVTASSSLLSHIFFSIYSLITHFLISLY